LLLEDEWQPHLSKVSPSSSVAEVSYPVRATVPAKGEYSMAPLKRTPTPPPCPETSTVALDSSIGEAGIVMVTSPRVYALFGLRLPSSK
jgi:hypothetical protein